MVQKMCTQMPPHDYSQRLYDEYRKVLEEYMIKTVRNLIDFLVVVVVMSIIR